MADVSMSESPQAPDAAPENPFGDGAGQLMLTAPFEIGQLHAELSAAVPGIATVLRHGVDRDAPCSPDNPSWLSFLPAAAAEVARVVKAHVPTPSDDRMKTIGGGGLAPELAGVREKLAAGAILSPEEASTAIALLLGVSPQAPGTQ